MSCSPPERRQDHLFSTRPSSSSGALAADAAAARQLAELRALRGNAYRRGQCCQRRIVVSAAEGAKAQPRGVCGRLLAAILWALYWLAMPPLFALELLGRALWVLWCSVFRVVAVMASSLLRPHFWMGVVAAAAAITWLARENCTPPSVSPQSVGAENRGGVSVQCSSDAAWVWQLLAYARQFEALALQWRPFLAGLYRDVVGMFDEAVEEILGTFFPGSRCRLRGGTEGAAAACAALPEVRAVRAAPDCAAVRRAHHDGQRHFHPDLLRLRHPACSMEALEACSVALNLAVESRRTELGCPGR
eukprot:TRINITY_DN17558_c0_g1_i1.p1 TRINITY_DN17558_c0_g1~~TRINITY_DN17558_c0_g1_i1.p1  ORF type:complete len:304 (-),score=47.49 TRINITY_DN17558_c0_g1_i1:44-955(-)